MYEDLENYTFNSSEFYKYFLYPNFIILNIISVFNGTYFITSDSYIFLLSIIDHVWLVYLYVLPLFLQECQFIFWLASSLKLQESFGVSCKSIFGKERLVGGSVESHLDMQCLKSED